MRALLATHAVDQRRRPARCASRALAGETHVARQRAAGEGAARRQVGRGRSAARSSGRARLPSRRRPTRSQSAAISLMNVTDVARNALIACLVISADSTDIHSMRSVIGAKQRRDASRGPRSSRTPTTTRSGFVNTSIALPSRRFSGEQAKRHAPPCGDLRPGLLEPSRSCRPAAATRRARARRRPGAETRPRPGAQHVVHVGAIVVVDRRVERDPDDVGACDRGWRHRW